MTKLFRRVNAPNDFDFQNPPSHKLSAPTDPNLDLGGYQNIPLALGFLVSSSEIDRSVPVDIASGLFEKLSPLLLSVNLPLHAGFDSVGLSSFFLHALAKNKR